MLHNRHNMWRGKSHKGVFATLIFPIIVILALMFTAPVASATPATITLSLFMGGQPLTSHQIRDNRGFMVTVVATLAGGTFPADTALAVTATGSGIGGVQPFTIAPFSMTIPAGEATARRDFPVASPFGMRGYGGETITVSGALTEAGVSVTPASFTLIGVEDIVLTVLDTQFRLNEGNTEIVNVPIGLRLELIVRGLEGSQGNGVEQPFSVDYAITGAGALGEGVAESGTLTVTSADTKSRRFEVVVPIARGDLYDENDEVRTITFSNPRLVTLKPVNFTGQDSVAVTLVDDDTISGLTLSADSHTLEENGGEQELTITAAIGDGQVVFREDTTFTLMPTGGTAAAGTDYTLGASPTITIPAKQKSATATLSIVPINDRMSGPDRTIVLGASTDRVTLAADAVAPVILTIADTGLVPGFARVQALVISPTKPAFPSA